MTTFGWSPFPYLDLTPFAFTVTGLALAWSLFRFRLLDIIPVAREVVIESMRDAVLVLDEQNRIVDLNPAAQRLLNRTPSEAVGQLFTQVFSPWPELVERYRDVTEADDEVLLGEGEAMRYFDLRISPLFRRNGHLPVTGRLIVLNDITEHKQAERALRESEERFRKIFEEAPIGMAIVGLDGRLLQVNKAFLGPARHISWPGRPQGPTLPLITALAPTQPWLRSPLLAEPLHIQLPGNHHDLHLIKLKLASSPPACCPTPDMFYVETCLLKKCDKLGWCISPLPDVHNLLPFR